MRHLIAIALALFAAAASAQPAAGHYYSLAEDGMYGYEVARGGDEPGAPLLMLGFNGMKDGVLQLMQLEHPNTVYVLQCRQPCEFYKVQQFRGAKFINTMTVRNRRGSRAWMAFEDAASGRLDRYVDRRQAKRPMQVWCTQAAGCNASAAPR